MGDNNIFPGMVFGQYRAVYIISLIKWLMQTEVFDEFFNAFEELDVK